MAQSSRTSRPARVADGEVRYIVTSAVINNYISSLITIKPDYSIPGHPTSTHWHDKDNAGWA